MKAFITVVDDNGRIFCKDQMITPIKEEIVDTRFFPTKQTTFTFTISEFVDCQFNEEPNDSV